MTFSCSGLSLTQKCQQKLCLPAACDDYVVQSGDTCVDIAKQFSVPFHQLTAWNPSTSFPSLRAHLSNGSAILATLV